MTYTVLARKYRPNTFGGVVGQETVVRALSNAVVQGRVAHAYLFSGPRGVGKTTTARLLAKALNCVNRTGAEPCDTCASCVDIREGNSTDVVEIDGASNRGIDEIRDLKERVAYAPAQGGYRVFIIDEVHMLTREAFNALLKTLEEPPPHVIFVFATTEQHKVPLTVRSRCQHYPFRLMSRADIATQLSFIVEKEGLEVPPASIDLIAGAGRGSLRDAEGLLDQVIAYAGESPAETQIRALLGRVETSWHLSLIEALAGGDAASLLRLLEGKREEGISPGLLVDGFLETLRDLLVLQAAPEARGLVDLVPEEADAVAVVGARLAADLPALWYQMALTLSERLRRNPSVPHLADVGFLQMQRVREMLAVSGAPEVRPPPRPSGHREPVTTARGAAGPPVAPEPVAAEPSDAAGNGEERWPEVVVEVHRKHPTIGHILEESSFLGIDGGTLAVGVPADQPFKADALREQANRGAIEATAARIFGRRLVLKVTALPAGREERRGAEAGRAALDKEIVRAATSIFQGRVIDIRKQE